MFLPVGILILAVFVAFAIAPGPARAEDPIELDIATGKPRRAPAHWLGTDELGRDILSRMAYGARTSIGVAFAVVVIGAVPIGTLVGTVAGFLGGRIDERADADRRRVPVASPSFVLAMALAAALEPRRA